MADMSNFTKEEGHEALAIAVAVSLYRYNTAPYDRAKLLYDHFQGACANCPSSKTGTLDAITTKLQQSLNKDIQVYPV